MATTDQIADSLENLSLDSQTKTSKVAEPVKKDIYGDNGSYMYQQTYGYMPYGPYSVPSPPLPAMGHDGLHALQDYHYPSPYHQLPLQTTQANASQVEVSTPAVADQASLSIETNKGNPGTITSGGGLSGNNEAGSLKSTFKSSSLNPNASYKRGGLPTSNLPQGYQDPRLSYDGIQSTIPWLDMSMPSNGQSKHAANGGFSSYTNNLPSGRNQNLHPFPHVMDVYSDNGSYMYPQTYGYMPYGAYSVPSPPLPTMGHDGLHALQDYHYPSPYYQLPLQTSEANASQVEVSTSGVADQASLSIETNKGNSSTIASGGGLSGNNGSGSLKSTFKSSSLNPNASYRKGGLPTGLSQGYQDPRFSYDGIQSTIPWFDMSMSSNGQSKHAANGGFSSYTNNLSSGRNQNLHPFPHVMNARPSSGVAQAYGYMNHMYPNNMTYGHYGNTVRGGSGYGSYGYDTWKKGRGWYGVGNNNKSRGHGYSKENMDVLSELNKGPRVKGYKNQNGFGPATLAVEDQNPPLTESNKDNNVSSVPDMDQYNKEDFPENYSDAKFFVIKSYSEDDVHKSIKYNVWASTSNGNKKLDAAFCEAKEKPDGCPVFLLFSVNTSGQFVGLAEMVGRVDFNETLEYWQQDKWTGCFPVKWHIVKDVPNASLRHIKLENNENKPVTNSRDTQEVNFEQGIQILKICKDHSSKTCILDDFEFYEARQKIIQERKAKYQLLQKQVSNGKPNDVVADSKPNAQETLEKSVEAALIEEQLVASAAEVVKLNGDVKVVEENGSVAATEDGPANSVCVAGAC